MKSERGSALVYVFIGIALFGALMFSFSRGSNSPNLSKNQDQIIASEFDSYAKNAETVINKLLANGCSQNDLRFYHPSFKNANNYSGMVDYPNYPANQCHVFAKNGGGGLTWVRPPQEIVRAGFLDYLFTGHIGVANVGSTNNNCTTTDFLIQLNVPKSTCIAYNNLHGVTNTGGEPPLFQYANNYQYSATHKGRVPLNYLQAGWNGNPIFNCQSTIAGPGSNPKAVELTGKSSGCYEANQERGQYYLYSVLIAR